MDDYLPTESSSFYNWAEQGKVVDYVIFMAYDEHYSGSKESGSVSSLPFVKNGVELGLKYIPAERVVVALPFYTRLWKETKKGKLASRPAVYGMSSAESLLQSHGATTAWDETTGQYYAEYKADISTGYGWRKRLHWRKNWKWSLRTKRQVQRSGSLVLSVLSRGRLSQNIYKNRNRHFVHSVH